MGCGSCSTGADAPLQAAKVMAHALLMVAANWMFTIGCHIWICRQIISLFIIEVKFKGSRKEFFLNNDNIYLETGELVVVEATTGGYDIGHVSLTGELVRMQMKAPRKEAD